MAKLSNDKLRMFYFLFHGNLIATVFYDLIIRNACRYIQADHHPVTFFIGIVFGLMVVTISIYSIFILYVAGFNSHDSVNYSYPNHMKLVFGLLIMIFMLKLAYVINKVFSVTTKLEDLLVYGFQILILSMGTFITFKITQIITNKKLIFCGK